MMKPSEDDLAALAAEHGTIYQFPFGDDEAENSVETSPYVFVYRRPTVEAWKRWMSFEQDDKKRPQGMLNLCADCVVWPSQDARAKVLEDVPGAMQMIGLEIISIGRGAAAERSKKYKPGTAKPAPAT